MDKIEFITSFFTFYLKGEIAPEKNFVKFKVPNTILGFIPLGSRNKTVAINQIASVDTSFKLLFKQLLFSIAIIIVGFIAMEDSIAGLIIVIAGIVDLLSSFQTLLVLNLTSGEYYVVSFIIFEKAKAEHAANIINGFISGRLDDTNVTDNTNRTIENNNANFANLVDAINKKK